MNVLIVDDDRLVRVMLKQILISLGEHVVGEAENGMAGVDASKQLQPELALFDISMPVMGGFPAARALKLTMPELTLIFVSNHCERHYLEEARDCGARGFVVKQAAFVQLPRALAAIKAGEEFYSPSII